MSVVSRLCLLASLVLASVITACGGSDEGNTSCDDLEPVQLPDSVCVSGQCQLDDRSGGGGGDSTTTDQGGGDTVDTGGDGGDSGGDAGFGQDDDIPDTTGPTIAFSSPKPGQVVGGIITIAMTVTDISSGPGETAALSRTLARRPIRPTALR